MVEVYDSLQKYIYIYIYIYMCVCVCVCVCVYLMFLSISLLYHQFALSAGAVEYTDCTSAEG